MRVCENSESVGKRHALSSLPASADDAPGTAAATAVGSVTVADASLVASPKTLSFPLGSAGTGVVASFNDADPNGTAPDYTASINWGDASTPTAGSISANGVGGFNITGTHTYSAPGSYPVPVTIIDAGGASAVANSTINVAADQHPPASTTSTMTPTPTTTATPAPTPPATATSTSTPVSGLTAAEAFLLLNQAHAVEPGAGGAAGALAAAAKSRSRAATETPRSAAPAMAAPNAGTGTTITPPNTGDAGLLGDTGTRWSWLTLLLGFAFGSAVALRRKQRKSGPALG